MKIEKGLILSLIALSLSLYLVVDKFLLKKKVGYVNFAEVYEKFDMKNELEAKFTKGQLSQKKKLDSLGLELTKLSRELNGETTIKFENLKDEYYLAKDQYNRETDAIMGDYKSQIFKQLEQYGKEYGEKNNYEFILSSEGILYKEESKNITNEVLEYSNKRYKGREK